MTLQVHGPWPKDPDANQGLTIAADIGICSRFGSKAGDRYWSILVSRHGWPRSCLQHCAEEQFAIHAYCVMVDHTHFVVEGQTEGADLRRLVHRWKTTTSHWWKQRHGTTLWQRGFHDRILEDHDALVVAVDYVLENPMREGEVERARDDPYSGPHGQVAAAL